MRRVERQRISHVHRDDGQTPSRRRLQLLELSRDIRVPTPRKDPFAPRDIGAGKCETQPPIGTGDQDALHGRSSPLSKSWGSAASGCRLWHTGRLWPRLSRPVILPQEAVWSTKTGIPYPSGLLLKAILMMPTTQNWTGDGGHCQVNGCVANFPQEAMKGQLFLSV